MTAALRFSPGSKPAPSIRVQAPAWSSRKTKKKPKSPPERAGQFQLRFSPQRQKTGTQVGALKRNELAPLDSCLHGNERIRIRAARPREGGHPVKLVLIFRVRHESRTPFTARK